MSQRKRLEVQSSPADSPVQSSPVMGQRMRLGVQSSPAHSPVQSSPAPEFTGVHWSPTGVQAERVGEGKELGSVVDAFPLAEFLALGQSVTLCPELLQKRQS